MLHIQSFNVKQGKMRAFQAWVKANENVFVKKAPPGWTYRGTYAYVLGFGRYGAATIWECRRYSDFDTWREHDDPALTGLFEKWEEYATEEPGEGVLLREIGDTRIIERGKVEGRKPRK